MNRRLIILIIAVLAGCHSRAMRKSVAPATQPMEPIYETDSLGDFLVVGKQDKGIAVYLTIDRREKTCLVEVQNATDAQLPIVDSWSDTSIYRGVGFHNLTEISPATKPLPVTPATMTLLLPAQVSRGSLALPSSPVHQQVRLRLYFGNSNLTQWMDVESPEFDLVE